MAVPQFDYASLIRLIILFTCFIMTAVGTARPQFQHFSSKYYLWKIKNGDTSIGFGDAYDCGSFNNKMRAAYAFAILAAIALAFAMVAVFFIVISHWARSLKAANRILRIISTVLSIFAWISLLIAWAISASGRLQGICGLPSPASQGYEIEEGLGLLIASWCLMFFDVPLAVLGLILNRDNVEETSKGTYA